MVDCYLSKLRLCLLGAALSLVCAASCKRETEKRGAETTAGRAGAPLLSRPIQQGGKIVLSPPTQAEAAARAEAVGDRAPGPAATEPGGVAKAYGYRFNARVFSAVSRTPGTIGIFRRGSWLPVVRAVSGPGCDGGQWHAVSPEGYVCTSDGVRIFDTVPPDAPTSRLPALGGALPYQYAYVKNRGAPLLDALPSEQDHARIGKARETGRAWPKVVHGRMNGDYFVAMAEKVETPVGAFWRRVRGKYVYESDLKPKTLPPMAGVPLSSDTPLPVAFVFVGRAPVFKVAAGGLSQVGHALKHARFSVTGFLEEQGESYVKIASDLAVPRGAVRLIEALPRPERVPEGARWIHIDLSEQTLVAYEADGPVFATLVSSGKPGYETLRGTFRVRQKYVTHTMSGSDSVDGYYDVAEVPWVLYYFKSYAVHGAYWHNDFGTTRSHGCVNLSPADAKWLFYWSSPALPPGWHAIRMASGTHVHITG